MASNTLVWDPLGDHPYRAWDADTHPTVEHGDTWPMKLTRNCPTKMWARGLLSSQEYSGQFERYLTGAFEAVVEQRRGSSKIWWTIPYVVSRVQQDTTFPPRVRKALLAVRVHGVAWTTACELLHVTSSQLARAEAKITKTYLSA